MAKENAHSRRQFLARGALALAYSVGTRPAAARSESVKHTIIDVHAHMPLLKFGGPLAPRLARTRKNSGAQELALARAVREETFDAIAAIRIAEMDRWGIAKTVVMPIDFSMGSDKDLQWAEAEAVATICNKHGERFIPFFACDPRRPDALELLGRAAKDLHVKGIKLHPLAGFAVDDEAACYAFYKKCSELNLPVLGHCRPIGIASRDDFARPERYARVAADFPELRICLGHFGGGPWTSEALKVVEKYPNAFGDVSTMQSLFINEPRTFGSLIRRAMDTSAKDRLMYGTDWPTSHRHDAAFVDALADGLPGDQNLKNSRVLNDDEVKHLLGLNASAFLGL